MNAIATFPRKELFARITEPIQRSLRENLSKGAERELWEVLSRRSAGKFGVEIEIELGDIASFLAKAFRTTYRAFKALVAKGFCKINRTLSGYGYRVVLLVPKGCEVDQNCADTLPVLSHLGHSNPHCAVTSIREVRKEQTGKEVGLENIPSQEPGLRSPLPKPKIHNQDLEPEPELTEALGLVAEYGNRTGDRDLQDKSRVRKSIANIARNLSPEKLLEWVGNAIAATEQIRLKGALQKPIECFLSVAIARGITPNVSKPKAAVEQPLENGAGRVYCAADFDVLGTHQAILPADVGHLVNPQTPDPRPPSESNSEFSEFSERISNVVKSESRIIPTQKEPPIEPSEPIDVSDLIALSRAYEADLGITPGDRVSAIESLIGVTLSHSSRLTDSQLLDYVRRLKELVDKSLRRSQ